MRHLAGYLVARSRFTPSFRKSGFEANPPAPAPRITRWGHPRDQVQQAGGIGFRGQNAAPVRQQIGGHRVARVGASVFDADIVRRAPSRLQPRFISPNIVPLWPRP